MPDKTIVGLVHDVHMAATNIGMDVSPSDVAFIIALFLEGFIIAAPMPGVDEWLARIVEEVNSVKDE